MKTEFMKMFVDSIAPKLTLYGAKITAGLIEFAVGMFFISIFTNWLKVRIEKKGKDSTLNSFVLSLTSIGLKVLLVISSAATMGFEIASFVAVIGAAGVAIGLALQGSLSNFAAGILILSFKPFKVGDFIEAKGYSGSVTEIQIFHTIIINEAGMKVIIPNSMLTTLNLIIDVSKSK